MGNKAGSILLNFCLKGLTFGFKGTLCCIIIVSYIFKSSYDQAKTSTYSFHNLLYLFLCSVVSAFETFTILGCSLVPILQSITFSSEDCIVGFKGVSSFKKILSKGTRPLGMKLIFSSIILWSAISFSVTPSICSFHHPVLGQLQNWKTHLSTLKIFLSQNHLKKLSISLYYQAHKDCT